MRVVNVHQAKTHLSRLIDEKAAPVVAAYAETGRVAAEQMARRLLDLPPEDA